MLVLDLPPQVQLVIEQNAQEIGISPESLATKMLSNQTELIEQPFNFDLDEMQKAVNGKFIEMPQGMAENPEQFIEWLSGAFQ